MCSVYTEWTKDDEYYYYSYYRDMKIDIEVVTRGNKSVIDWYSFRVPINWMWKFLFVNKRFSWEYE